MKSQEQSGSDKILYEIKDLTKQGVVIGRSGKENQVRGLSTVNNIKTLIHLFQKLKPQKTMEIGLAFGASALAFARLFKERGDAPRGQHVAIDPFQENPDVWDSAGLMAIEKRGLLGYVKFIPELSSLALPQLVREKRQMDMIYVDGSHIFENVFVDFFYCRQLLSKNGIILFDDSSDPHVKKCLKFIQINFAGRLKPFDLSQYQTGRNPYVYRLGELLGKTQLRAFQKIGEDEREWNTPYIDF